MMKPRLLACPGCARHVRVSESACPFCGAALPDSFGAGDAPRKPARLTRAALYALGATSLTIAATASAGCGTSGGGSGDSGSDQMAVAAYGCPPDACGPAREDGSPGDAGPGDDGPGDMDVTAAYGGPGDAFPVDVQPADAGKADADSGSSAAYGLPGF
jgi:hypothetical protein